MSHHHFRNTVRTHDPDRRQSPTHSFILVRLAEIGGERLALGNCALLCLEKKPAQRTSAATYRTVAREALG